MQSLMATVFLSIVMMAILYLLHQQRSLAERLVDGLYKAARIVLSVAESMDSALVQYRSTRRRIVEAHVPRYAGVDYDRA